MMTLTLLFRPYCSLCHQMRDELQKYQQQYDFQLEIIDIDDHPDLEAQYNELVPVLLHQDRQLCHWQLDHDALLRVLNAH